MCIDGLEKRLIWYSCLPCNPENLNLILRTHKKKKTPTRYGNTILTTPGLVRWPHVDSLRSHSPCLFEEFQASHEACLKMKIENTCERPHEVFLRPPYSCAHMCIHPCTRMHHVPAYSWTYICIPKNKKKSILFYTGDIILFIVSFLH